MRKAVLRRWGAAWRGLALAVGFSMATLPTANAQEDQRIFEGGHCGNSFGDDWFYDSYSYDYDPVYDPGWYDYDVYDGYYDDEMSSNDWYYDSYDDPGEEHRKEYQEARGLAEDNLQTLTGKVVETKAVQLRGSDVQHQAVLVRTTENVLLVADLGPSTNPRTQPVRQGQQVTIVGRTGRVGDRAVLLAAMIKSGNRTIEVERTEEVAAQKRELDMEKPSELTGYIRRQKEVDIRGTNQKHQVILLEAQDGYQLAVDLGPDQALPEMERGQEITVTGHPVQIGERLVFWAHELRDAEENTTTIQRSKAGAEPRGTRQMDQQPKDEMKETRQRAQ